MEIENSDVYLYHFNQIKGIGFVILRKIFNKFGNFEEAFNSNIKEFNEIIKDQKILNQISGFQEKADELLTQIKIFKKELDRKDIRLISYFNKNYPESLRDINKPPPILFIRGQMLFDKMEKSISIIGTRNPSLYGHLKARKIAKELAEKSYIIISGLARGIDIEAHIGALEGGGKTIAVLASGVYNIYPSEHEELAKDIIENGAIISESGIETRIARYSLIERNRIISGLSKASLIIEGSMRSGTYHEAKFAMEQKKIIFALTPFNNKREIAKLPLHLISNNGAEIESAMDILKYFNFEIKNRIKIRDSDDQSKIIREGDHFKIIQEEVQLDTNKLIKLYDWNEQDTFIDFSKIFEKIDIKELLINTIEQIGKWYIILKIFKNNYYSWNFFKRIEEINKLPIEIILSEEAIYTTNETKKSYNNSQILSQINPIRYYVEKYIKSNARKYDVENKPNLNKFL